MIFNPFWELFLQGGIFFCQLILPFLAYFSSINNSRIPLHQTKFYLLLFCITSVNLLVRIIARHLAHQIRSFLGSDMILQWNLLLSIQGQGESHFLRTSYENTLISSSFIHLSPELIRLLLQHSWYYRQE